jgi:hypothetical protein
MSATKTLSAYATTGFSLGRAPLRLTSVHGLAATGNTNAVLYLGIYKTSIDTGANLGLAKAPAASDVPKWQMTVTGKTTTNDFQMQFANVAPVLVGPCYFAVSSTDGLYTSTADVVDIFLEVEQYEEDTALFNTIITTSAASANTLTVWTDTIAGPSAPNALLDVLIQDLGHSSGAQLYLQIFAGAVPNAGDVPLACFKLALAGGASINLTNITGATLLNFGDVIRGGKTFLQQGEGTLGKNNATTGTNYSSCYLYISTTALTLTAGVANAANIVARYVSPTTGF